MSDVQPEFTGIQAFLNPRYLRVIKPIPRLCCALVVFICTLTLAGWTFDIGVFKSISPRFIAMMPNTALCLMLSSAALFWEAKLSRPLALLVMLIGALTLGEYLSHSSFGIDTILYAQPDTKVRMEPITAINFCLLGLSLFFLSTDEHHKHPLSHSLAFAIATIALLPATAYLYGSRFTIGIGGFSAMAPHTAFCFILLSAAILIAHPNHDLAAVFVSDGPGGALARRILPVTILIPLGLGWLRVLGERTGIVSAEFGTALFTTITIAGFGATVWLQCIALQSTELRRRNAQRERDTLDIQNAVRDQFIAMISHDLRTPLTAASGYAQLIQRFPDRETFAKENAQKLLASLSRVDNMIRDLLDASRVRAGHPIELHLADCDAAAIVQTTVYELSVIHGDRFVLEGDAQALGHWDPLALQRAIENLCNNAIKYGSRDLPITVRVARLSGKIHISVHNWGKPIPPQDQQTLFSPFQRSSTAAKTGIGWGLGLALVRLIAEAHGGRVFVESTAEYGTCFTLELPEVAGPSASCPVAS